MTTFDRSTSMLQWTNDICVNEPVYEVLRAFSPLGPWESLFRVTNTDTALLTNSLGTMAGAVFHKLHWLSDTPSIFDYAMYDGFGFAVVTGVLVLNFSAESTNIGTWFCEETRLREYDTGHPTVTYPRGNLNYPAATIEPQRFWGQGISVTGTTQFIRL